MLYLKKISLKFIVNANFQLSFFSPVTKNPTPFIQGKTKKRTYQPKILFYPEDLAST